MAGDVPRDTGQAELRTRVVDSQNKGDSAWTRRFGNANGDRGDQSLRRNEDNPRDGNWGRRVGDGTGPNNRRGDIDQVVRIGDDDNQNDANRNIGGRDFGGRDFGDKDSVNRKYQDWKKGDWDHKRGEGRDHRDWSGRWKDGDRFVAADKIRGHWRGRWRDDDDHHDVPFCGGWWKDRDWHGRHWDHWDHFAFHHHRPFFWWDWCSAPRLTTWVTFGWAMPYYWDYGPGEYIYCYNDVIYVNGQWFQPAPVFYDQTLVLAQRAPDLTPEQAVQVEWLPLGVFAVARDGVADHNLLIQIAVTKDGVIGGTVFNQATGASFPVEGTVDKQSQRAVWTYVDANQARIVMETSVYNLTQPQATGLVHYGPNDIQVVELVRLEEPSAGAAPAANPPAPAVQ